MGILDGISEQAIFYRKLYEGTWALNTKIKALQQYLQPLNKLGALFLLYVTKV